MQFTALEMRDKSSTPASTQVSIQIVGLLETDVFCIFLGKVWKMRSSERSSARAALPASGNLPTPAVTAPHSDDSMKKTPPTHTQEDETTCR